MHTTVQTFLERTINKLNSLPAMHCALTAKIKFCCNICGYFETANVNMSLMIYLKKIMSLTFAAGMSLFLLQNSAWGAQNTLELHSGSVKLIREGKSQIIRTVGEKLQLLANDRLQTGGDTDISLYLRDGEDTVKLYSNSFFKLDDSSDEGNSLALLIGRLNFSVKPLPENAGAEEEAVDNAEKKTEQGEKRPGDLAAKLKGKLAKLEKSKLRPKKRRFELRTISALIGVRGTKGECRAKGSVTELGTTDGQVEFSSVEAPDAITTVSAGQYSQVKEGSYPSEVTSLGPGGSLDGVVPGPAKPIDDFAQRAERALDDDWLDRIEETNDMIGNAENAIDAIKTKTLTLSMTFTNR